MEVLWVKLIAALTLLVLIPCCGALPFLIANRVSARSRQVFLSLANAFAGGIFLGGGFVHLLTDANKEFDSLLGDAFHVQVGMVLAPVGLLFAFFVEKVLLKGHDHAHGAPDAEPPRDAHGHAPARASPETEHAEEGGTPLRELPVVEEAEERGDEKKRLNDAAEGTATDSASAASSSSSSSHRRGAARNGAGAAGEAPNELLPYLLAFVLSIHSVIGGMALGIQSSPAKVTPLFIAILSHKWIEAFALGASILKNSTGFKAFARIIVFYSLTSPVGILLGIILDKALQGVWAGGVITAVLTALAAGSFIYVAIVDILVEEFSNARQKWSKLLLCIGGLAFNTFISIMFEEHE